MGSFVIAVDGTAASGKTSVAERLAALLDGVVFDTGLLYRALAWLAAREDIPPEDGPRLAALAARLAVARRPLADGRGCTGYVAVDGADPGPALHDPAVDACVSAVAGQPEVRAALLPAQRAVATDGYAAVAGRDIGTAVFPDAPLKVYLLASPEERARRRVSQRGELSEFGQVLAAILERDAKDARQSAPALDAVAIETEGASVDEVADRIVALVRAHSGGDHGCDR